MGNLGTPEIILIALVILVLFGAKKIPEFMQGLGKGVREFKKASSDIQEQIEREVTRKDDGQQCKCTFCDTSIAKDAKFCPSCGKSLEDTKCLKCNTVNQLGSKFCKECGAKLIG